MATRDGRAAGLRRGAAIGLALVGVLGVASPRDAAAAGHSDAKLGFSMQIPSGWKEIPIAGEEKFIVAKYLSEREYADKKEGYTHTPDLKVLIFPKGAKKTAKVEEGEGVSFLSIENPYKNYPDYVKSDNTGGGHFISKEDKLVVNGIDTTWYEVKYEKLTVARRAIAFAYHFDDCDYAAQYEVLESYWDKLSPALITALKSFKIFPRKGTIKRETTGDGSGVTVTSSDSKLTDEERAKKRQEKFEQRVRIGQERLPDGWKMKRSKNFVAFTHVDMKYTDYVLDQAEALRAWLDANFGWVGTGYVSGDVIRICTNYDEERAFRDTSSRSGSWSVSEVTMSRDGGQSEFRYLNDRIQDRYFRERNSDLAFKMPPWLSRGIDRMIASSYMKAGKLEFRADGQEILAVRLAAKAGKLAKPRDIVLATYKPFAPSTFTSDPSRMKPSEDPLDQAPGFVRWLVIGPGSKNPRTKELLRTYIEALLGVERTIDLSKMPDEPKTEEEEEERFKNKQSAWRDNEKQRLQEVFDKVFGQWTDADWSAVEKSYTAYVS